jgi:acetyltransferase-like isoleucine patch superfamily enzyme
MTTQYRLLRFSDTKQEGSLNLIDHSLIKDTMCEVMMLSTAIHKTSKLLRFLTKPYHDKLNTVSAALCRLKGILYYRRIFGSFGVGSSMGKPLFLSGSEHIHIGKDVFIRRGVRLQVISTRPDRTPEFLIGDGVDIEQQVQIVCHCKVIIGKNVGIGPNCIIMDTSHPFFDVHNPQPIYQRLSSADSYVEIGDGAQIGAGTFVMPNVRIGKCAVIGANSVVTKSVPDYSVASGNPAIVRMRFDHQSDRWLVMKE